MLNKGEVNKMFKSRRKQTQQHEQPIPYGAVGIADYRTGIPGRLWWKPEGSLHMIIAGQTGAGKSNIMNLLIDGATRYNGQHRNIEIVGIDAKRGKELLPWDDIGRLSRLAITPEEALIVLREEVEYMYERDRITSSRFSMIDGMRVRNKDWSAEDGPFRYIIIDELAAVIALKNDISKECLELLSILLAQSRSAGITVVMATQYPHSEIVPTTLRNNIPIRVCGKLESAKSIEVVMGGLAEQCSFDLLEACGPGWAYVSGFPSIGGGARFVQFPYFDKMDIPKLGQKYRNPFADKAANDLEKLEKIRLSKEEEQAALDEKEAEEKAMTTVMNAARKKKAEAEYKARLEAEAAAAEAAEQLEEDSEGDSEIKAA